MLPNILLSRSLVFVYFIYFMQVDAACSLYYVAVKAGSPAPKNAASVAAASDSIPPKTATANIANAGRRQNAAATDGSSQIVSSLCLLSFCFATDGQMEFGRNFKA